MTYRQFTYNATGTPYSMSDKFLIGIGKAITLDNGTTVFAANTFGQRHPTTGDLVWLHRLHAKFMFPWWYFSYDPIPRAWTHMAKQAPRSSWRVVSGVQQRKDVPAAVVLPHQHIAMIPLGDDVKYKAVPDKVL